MDGQYQMLYDRRPSGSKLIDTQPTEKRLWVGMSYLTILDHLSEISILLLGISALS